MNGRRAVAVAVFTVFGLTGCGNDTINPTAGSTPHDSGPRFTGDPDSDYCKATRANFALFSRLDKTDPVAIRTLVTRTGRPGLEKVKRVAPAEISDAVAINADWQLNEIPEVFAKYDFDPGRFGNATSQEKAILDYRHPSVKDASDTVDRYDYQVCGIDVPSQSEPLDVTFEGDPSSEYCTLARQYHSGWNEIDVTGLNPERVKSFFTTVVPGLRRRGAAVAPNEIRTSFNAITAFDNARRIPTLAKYGFDFGRVLTEARPEERAVVYRRVPEISEHARRIDTYGIQICTRG